MQTEVLEYQAEQKKNKQVNSIAIFSIITGLFGLVKSSYTSINYFLSGYPRTNYDLKKIFDLGDFNFIWDYQFFSLHLDVIFYGICTVSGIGLLFFKNWARIGLICAYTYNIVYHLFQRSIMLLNSDALQAETATHLLKTGQIKNLEMILQITAWLSYGVAFLVFLLVLFYAWIIFKLSSKNIKSLLN
ncbi:hypothetical protein KMW28_06300 [Flammeovirga yaeyamensis]|uniref:Uncharacterized protein n=1 Tax=Flammeovirga yaeyamensis TaxID=367791 RepID=A0AAX1NC06_9BACT|nr:hypothetical protein [Flammeovirga yaeyamensis]MBB3697783.1 hypothetical protein [Flammeovirga yaeyamensis]NMF35861.1 hypothetical protein [Flammeovirga yaeyamensis]QWG03188.1 hypothetical protein KMW28_06300 [Flammeovirga yaeyamensis]